MKTNLFRLTAALCLVTSGCSTGRPLLYGSVGGAAVGAGVGAMVAKTATRQATTGIASVVGGSSGGMSLAQSIGAGAIIGVPAGILVAYTSNAIVKYYELGRNSRAIDANQERIIENQREIARQRARLMNEE